MIVPSRRWFVGAALLALIAPLALWWPGAATLLVVADAAWLALLAVEVWRAMAITATSTPTEAAADGERSARRGAASLTVTREAPGVFSVGRPLPATYRWWSQLGYDATVMVEEELPAQLALALGPSRRLQLPAGGATTEPLLVRPLRRGALHGGALHVRVSSPWRLAWRTLHLPMAWDALVLPPLAGAALRGLPSQVQRRREAGLRAVRRLGEGRVFESLREWVPGDDTRAIDWKATARRGIPMVRQYEDERRQQLLIAIDAGRLMTAELDGQARLEFVVNAALQLTHAAVDHDDDVGLVVFSDTVQTYLPPARGRRALRAVLEALATVEGRLVEPDYPAACAFIAQRNRRRALTVLFSDVVDPTASEALVTQFGSLVPRHLPLAVSLRDPVLERLATAPVSTSEGAYERAAAEELLEAREEALVAMRSRGIVVLDVPPADAAEAVVAQYESLKRLGRV